jgi:hypothetical protein
MMVHSSVKRKREPFECRRKAFWSQSERYREEKVCPTRNESLAI